MNKPTKYQDRVIKSSGDFKLMRNDVVFETFDTLKAANKALSNAKKTSKARWSVK